MTGLFRFLALTVSVTVLLVASVSGPTAGAVGAAAPPTARHTYVFGAQATSAQEWVVPAGVTAVTVDALGSIGRDTFCDRIAGNGGEVVATLPVTPGETLQVNVADSAGGQHVSGNASDVRRGAFALSDRMIVAGGGGSDADFAGRDAGGNCTAVKGGPGAGGDGGAPSGTTGNGEVGCTFPAGGGGGGGTQDAGGVGGTICGAGGPGSPGTFGFGGTAHRQAIHGTPLGRWPRVPGISFRACAEASGSWRISPGRVERVVCRFPHGPVLRCRHRSVVACDVRGNSFGPGQRLGAQCDRRWRRWRQRSQGRQSAPPSGQRAKVDDTFADAVRLSQYLAEFFTQRLTQCLTQCLAQCFAITFTVVVPHAHAD